MVSITVVITVMKQAVVVSLFGSVCSLQCYGLGLRNYNTSMISWPSQLFLQSSHFH